MSAPRITLLTDFGTRDGYVGAMKGVIAGLCATAIIDDISHDIEQGDIIGAAYALTAYCNMYPKGTVHIVVVDPGVGSERRAIAARTQQQRYLIGPDNGVFGQLVGQDSEVRALPVPADASNTFHGRDVFAPAAARLAGGWPFRQLGPVVSDIIQLEMPALSRERCQILHVDHFGNLITNSSEIPKRLRIADRVIEMHRTYADVEPGALLALLNSRGLLEIAVRNGSAARQLNVGRGTSVELEY